MFGYNSCSQGDSPKALSLGDLPQNIETVYASLLDCIYLQDGSNTLYAVLPTNTPLSFSLETIAHGVRYVVIEAHQV